MNVTVRCFAAAREALGQDLFECEVAPGTTVSALRATLLARAPALAAVRFVCAVNRAYARDDQELRAGDEVALIPPISGGAPARFAFAFVRGEIDARTLEHEVRTDHDGAVVTFTGVTRDHHEGAAVRTLHYEAYEAMAAELMRELFEAAARQFEIGRARVVHRLGEVPIGAASVVVVVAAPHRGAAFDACRFLMDRLKASVPVFKREVLAGDAGQRWIGELPQTPGDG